MTGEAHGPEELHVPVPGLGVVAPCPFDQLNSGVS